DYRKATMKTLRVAFLSSCGLDCCKSLSLAFVTVGVGLRLIDGTVLLFPGLTILILAPEYFSTINQVGKYYYVTLYGQIAMAEIEQVLKQKVVEQKEDSQIPIFKKESKLRLNSVTVKKEDVALLQSVDITFHQGLLGLVGPSGAGKTTLLQLLAGRLTPTEGHIELDDYKLASLDHEGWEDQVAYIPQHPY